MLQDQMSGDEVHKSCTGPRAAFVNSRLYVWVMVKLLEAVNGGRNLPRQVGRQQVDLFLCREFCNGSTAKCAAAKRGRAREGYERVAGAFGRRLGKVG
jgi:hypothetical protein